MNWLTAFYPGDSAMLFVAVYLMQVTLLLAIGLLMARRYRWDAAMRHHLLALTWIAVTAAPALTWGLGSSPLVVGWQRSFLGSVSAWVVAASDEPVGPAPVASDECFASPVAAATIGAGPLPAAASAPAVTVLDYRAGAVALAFVWLGGLLAGLVRLGNAAHKLAGVRRRSTPAGRRIGAVCEQVARELGLARTPEVRLSADCGGPVLIGLWRPALLFPEWIAETLPPEKLRQVVVHEMAHVARRDHFVVWGQHLFSAWFWFHPLAYRFNRELALAREELCDNHVLSGAAETDYGYTLLSVAEAAGEAVAPRLAVGLFTETWSLESRIAQILNDRRKTMTHVSRNRAGTAGLVALSLTAALALCSPLVAHETSPDEAAEDAKVEKVVLTKGPDGVVEEVEVIESATTPEAGKVIVTKGADGKVEAIRVMKKAKSPKKAKAFWFKHGAGASGDRQPNEKLFFYKVHVDASGDGQPPVPPKPPLPPADLIERASVEIEVVAEGDPLAPDQLAKILEKHVQHANERAREAHLHARRVELRLLEAQAALAEEEASAADHKHQIKEKGSDPFASDQSKAESLLEKKLLEAQRELAIQKRKFNELAEELERRIKLADERAKESQGAERE